MWTRPMACALVPFLAILVISCDDNNNTTVVNQGLDCGLIRAHLLGSWTVDIVSVSRSLQDCTGLDPSFNGLGVSTADFPATYSPMDVFGSDGSTSFKLQADRSDGNNDVVNPELTGSVQADSCLAMVRLWDRTDALFLQCIGTFEITNQTLSGACDSAEIDSDADSQLDTSCSLSSGISFNASIH